MPKLKTTTDLTARIAKAAYELFEERGRTGEAVQDWDKAEREVRKDTTARSLGADRTAVDR
jgi:hypothetical protein